MTSTVLDGVLCLLLISAAVVTVTTATPNEPVGEGRAPAVATTLTTTTASVNYTLTPRGETTPVTVPTEATDLERTAHGTLAELLARATVGRAAAGGDRLSYASAGFERAVIGAVRGVVRANHTQIVATWRPHPGSSVGGRLVVGDQPPPARPVHAATVDASSGLPPTRTVARRAARERGVPGLAAAIARRVVRGLFPPTYTRAAASEPSASGALVRHRYRRAESVLGVTPPAPLVSGGVDTGNDRLAAALATRVADDVRDSDAAATTVAERVRVGRVRIVVRTWP